MAAEVRYESLGTFEFLLDAADAGEPRFYFIEANPRLQVEHTVTEEVTGLDLVALQLRLAAGGSLASVGLDRAELQPPRGYAIQLRINMETMEPDGTVKPSGGTLAAFEPPAGGGLRVDSLGYVGYTTSPRFDSLLAKLIVRSPSPRFADAVRRARRALAEFKIEGVPTNIGFLRALLGHADVEANRVHTRFVEDNAAELALAARAEMRGLYFDGGAGRGARAGRGAHRSTRSARRAPPRKIGPLGKLGRSRAE